MTDRSILVRDYLDTWLAGKKLRLKRDTYLSYVEACELYDLRACVRGAPARSADVFCSRLVREGA